MDQETFYIKLLERIFNTLEPVFILGVLFMAFIFQFFSNELPCPLCLLQRIGFLMIACGFLLNLRFGLRPSHYALIILSCLFTAFVALRQIALHLGPSDTGYGSAVFGLHMYTWSFIIGMLILIATTVLMSIDRQYSPYKKLRKAWKPLTFLLLLIVLCFSLINIISTFAECGWQECPDNPTSYKMHSAYQSKTLGNDSRTVKRGT